MRSVVWSYSPGRSKTMCDWASSRFTLICFDVRLVAFRPLLVMLSMPGLTTSSLLGYSDDSFSLKWRPGPRIAIWLDCVLSLPSST